MSIYDTLNKEQQEACFHTEGPVLILAGAGSGKTRVITHRIAYLMEECNVNPWNILAITFTNKAAGEMRERVDKLIGFGSEAVWISTFHSMCVRILRRHIDLIGYDNNFTIYDTDDVKTLIRQIMQQLRIDPKKLRERTVMAEISSAKDKLQDSDHYMETHHNNFMQKQVGDIYAEYERQLRGNNALDFDDLLMKTVELFRAREDVLANYQERFHYIMVDEYQDTNEAQFQLVRLLAGKYRNLCVVGDDDQSIYKFRGADIHNILNFEKIYPDALVVKLEQNYRSTQNILDAANSVIHHNVDRKNKRLWTDQGAGDKIHYRAFMTGRDEAAFIANNIRKRMAQPAAGSSSGISGNASSHNPGSRSLPAAGSSSRTLDSRSPSSAGESSSHGGRPHYRDFAVLYRTNAQSRLLEDAFVMQSIPYNIVGGHNFYDRMEVRDILAYLRAINNDKDDINIQRILNIPKRGIGKTTQDRLVIFARAHGLSFLEALGHVDEIPDIGRAKAKLTSFWQLMQELRAAAGTLGVEELVKKVVSATGYEAYLQDYDGDDERFQDRMGNVNELISKAATYEEDALQEDEGPSLAGFLEEVALVADIDQVGEADDRVLLMTLHSAKGLEFPYVYLAGMDENIFPSYMSIQADQANENHEALEEERRLAYVGITRAKKDLTLTHAASRMMRGEVQDYAVSRFVLEIPSKLLDQDPREFAYVDEEDYYDDTDGELDGLEAWEHTPPAADHTDAAMPWNSKSAGRGASYGRGGSASAGTSYGRGGSASAGTSYDKSNVGAGTSYGSFGAGTASVHNKSVSGTGSSGTSLGEGTTHSTDGRPATGRKDTRLKATYVKPHTREDKKPYIARMNAGLDAIGKGIPAGVKPDYQAGDRVHHIKYGDGTVLDVEKAPKDYKVKVNFDEAGQKIMYAAFAKLVKIS